MTTTKIYRDITVTYIENGISKTQKFENILNPTYHISDYGYLRIYSDRKTVGIFHPSTTPVLISKDSHSY